MRDPNERADSVTQHLPKQAFAALETLLVGFQAAAERNGRDPPAHDADHVYKGLVSVVLRLIFVLYTEEVGLLPVAHPSYFADLSARALFDQLDRDDRTTADAMPDRFGAWARLLTLFRAVYFGFDRGDLHMPARGGALFDPRRYPFLDGCTSTPPDPQVIDDATVFRVLAKLVMFEGRRIPYRTMDVEQIGSIYEALIGSRVARVNADAVRLRPHGVWVSPGETMAIAPARRAKWLKETTGLSAAHTERLLADVSAATDAGAQLDAMTRFAVGGRSDPQSCRARAGQLVLQPGSERRRTGSHYTPRSLSAPIVRRTLEPLLAAMGDAPSSEKILQMKVCDPAMGSGSFLIEACRYLADHLVAAWRREGVLASLSSTHDDPVSHARRVVAQRCLYGVDKNEVAVDLAKLSLWLVTLASDLPFTFVDQALRHGDSLVGLSLDQIRSFHWKPSVESVVPAIDAALCQLADGALDANSGEAREHDHSRPRAQEATNRMKLIADLCVGAFFAKDTGKQRETERERRLQLVTAWLQSGDDPTDELRSMQTELRARIPAFHWHLEFAPVAAAEHLASLRDGRVNFATQIDAFVGNPPFAGKNVIAEGHGARYIEFLRAIHPGSHGAADLSAHFFRRADSLLAPSATIGFIATNTIAEGDTRETGLRALLARGLVVYSATRSMWWPGDAAVAVSVVHLAKGAARKAVERLDLDGVVAQAIDSRLRARAERPDPIRLAANANLAFQGSIVLGMGFTLSAAERERLVARDASVATVIQPYLSGEDANSHPCQAFGRYVINFGALSLQDVARWPELLQIVTETVKPERERASHSTAAWWHFERLRPQLYQAIRPFERCLVTARHSKHLAFAFQSPDKVFSEGLYVFAVETASFFAAVQSRAHIAWTKLLSSTLGHGGVRYSASDCFETFPFPKTEPTRAVPQLESIAHELYAARARYMTDRNVGLTITYNRMNDPVCTEAGIVALRSLHEDMDREVVRAYGWDDLVAHVPPYCVATDEDRAVTLAFEHQLIERLFVLNTARAEQERKQRDLRALPLPKPQCRTASS